MKNSNHCENNLIVGSVSAILLLFTLAFVSGTASADDKIRYVSDMLIINLKTSVEAPFKVVAKLYSNDKLEVLETDGRFSRVRTEDGKEGWIASQYLTSKTPKTVIIEELTSQLDTLRSDGITSSASTDMIGEFENLKRLNSELQTSNNRLAAENESLNVIVEQLKQQVEQLTSKTLMETRHSEEKEIISHLQAENKLLSKEVEELSIKNQGLLSSVTTNPSDKTFEKLRKRSTALAQENSTLRSKVNNLEFERMIYWFLAGAIVFFAGMISGKIFGKKTRKLGY
jgi:SH3 domain protein